MVIQACVAKSGEDSAQECFPPGGWLQQYANTDQSIVDVTTEEPKAAQSQRETLLYGTGLNWKIWY